MEDDRPHAEAAPLTPQQEAVIAAAWKCTPEEIGRLLLRELPRIQRTKAATRPVSSNIEDTQPGGPR